MCIRDSESDMVRGYAITALGDIGVAYPEHKREFIKFMEENLKNESEDWGKIHYYTELCRLGQSNYLTLLLEGLKNTDYSVRHAAINSLYPIFCTNNYGTVSYTHLDVYKRQHYMQLHKRTMPKPGPEDVFVKMEACNICTTDYQQWMGLRDHQGFPRCV